MNLRQLLHIVISYTLLFPPGVLPVSTAFAANQQWDSSAVSVGTVNSGSGSELSQPVSVTFPSSGVGSEQSKPVSVTFPSSGTGIEQSKPVSVTMASAVENGTYMSVPAAVSFQTGTMGDPDLVGLWHMDDNWDDSSGNNRHGSAVNGPGFSSDMKIGTKSGSFDGSNDYVELGNWFNYQTFTIEMWANPGSTQVQYADIIDNNHTDYRSWVLQQSGSNTNYYCWGVRDKESLSILNSICFTLPANTWTHLAITRDGNTRVNTVYINGSPLPTVTGTNDLKYDGTQYVRISRWGGGGRYWKGLLDEVAMYKRALTAEEIAFHAKGGAIDPLAPAAPVLDSVPSVVGSSSITLSGTKTASTSIWVNSKKVADLDDLTVWQGIYAGLVPGTNLLSVVAADSDYRQSSPVSATVIYDTEPPVIESSSPENNSDSAKPVSSVLVTFKDTYADINTTGSLEGATMKNSAGDAMTGTWFTSGSKSIMFTPAAALPADTYTVTVYPVDSVGNRGEQQITFRNYDLTSPKTTVSLSGTKGVDGWYTTPVTVTLAAEDGQQGAGIDRIEYSFDGLNWNTYAAPFTLSTDGITTLYYRAVDTVGNKEENTTLKNVALATNGGAAFATSVHKNSSSGCEFLAVYAVDGKSVQENTSSSDCSSTGLWIGTNSQANAWMARFSGTKAVNKLNWMMWSRSTWTDPQSQPKDYVVEYTADAVPSLSKGNWQPVPSLVVTNTDGIVDQATASVTGNTMGNWLYDTTQKWVSHEFTTVSATALRLRIISKVSGTAYGPALGEVEVYEPGFSKSEDIKINTSGLVGMWRMDNDWEDSSVAGNHGIPRNEAAFSTDPKIGSHAGSFDGSNDYIEIKNASVLNPGAITVETWAKSNATTWNNTGYLISKRDAYILSPISGTKEIRFYIYADGAWRYVAYNDTNLDITQWHHYAGTFDGLNLNVYIDGVKQSTFYSGSMNPVDTGSLYFGWDDGQSARYFNGLLDEVAIYNRALTDEEIQAHFRNYVITPPTIDPAPPSVTDVASLSLGGTKPENTAVMVNGVEVAAFDGNTTWQGTYALSPGMNTLSITAMDADGFHSKAVSLSVAYDNAPPEVTSTIPANNSFQNTPVNSVTFNITDAYSSLKLEASASGAQVTKSGSLVVGGWSLSGAGSSGTITFTPLVSLTEGVYEATITPTDSFDYQSSATITFTVDSTPPAAPAFDQASALTNNTSIIVTGTKAADISQVVLTGTGMSIGAVTYPSSTTWSVTVSGLNEGTYALTAYGLDLAGNQSGSNTMSIVVDRTAPGKPTVSYTQLTKETAVTLSGTKPANSYLYVDSQLTGNDFTGTTWSYGVSLSEGDNSFSVYTKDAAGNTSEAVTATVTRDTAAPALASSVPGADSFVNAVAAITVNLSDTPAGADLQGSINGAEVKVSNAAVSGSWSVSESQLVFTPSSDLSDGVYTVTLHPVDAIGNTGTVSFSFTLDTAAPVFQSLTMDPTSPHKAETVKFKITFSEDMLTSAHPLVTFTTGGLLAPTYSMTGSWTSSKTWQGSYTFTVSTGDGTYSLNISDAKDKAGNVMSAKSISNAFELDTTPATPTIDPVTTPTNNANQTLKGTKEAGASIIINGTQRVAADSKTTWSCNYPLAEGTNTLTIIARDSAGNDSPAISPAPVIVLDSKAPEFTVAYTTPWSTDTQTLTGAKEAGCVVKLNGTQIFGTDDVNTTWSYTVSLTQGVTSRFAFTAADGLGNTTSKTIDILYDLAAPATLGPGVLTADGSGNGTEVTLSWTAYPETSDVAYYAVYRSSSAFSDVAGMIPVATVNKGTMAYKATGLVQGSTYYFAVVPVDQAGNQTNSVNSVSAVPTDTAAPEDVTNLSATAGYTTGQGNVITLAWTASSNSNGDLASQLIYVDSGAGYDAGTALAKTDTTFSKTGLNDGTKYKFKVTVKDTAGYESQGAVIEAVTRLDNPANVTATAGSAKVSLSWSAVSSSYVKAYRVYRATSDAQMTDVSQMTLVAEVTQLTYTDTGVANDTTYQYAVTVKNTSGAERSDVQSVSATPRADSAGPVIDSFSISTNQVITAPITITASAHDAESDMDKVELYIDGVLVTSALRTPNSTLVDLSYSWNVVTTTDGNHTVKVKALDSKGNATEDSRQVIVSLAPPAVPVITGHIVSQTTPTYTVTVSGTAPVSTTVSLKVNGTVTGQAQTSDSGTFSFSSIQLPEGDNILNAKASHRGGESAYSSDYKITVDTGAPSAPKDLSAQVQSGGIIKFTWSSGAGETPTGYNLYVSSSSFSSIADTGVSKTNSSPITYSLKEYIPGDDNLKYYGVTALDSSGNESALSNIISLSSDQVAPSVVEIQYSRDSEVFAAGSAVGAGIVNVTMTVTETLKEAPFFSLEPAEGSPIVLSMTSIDGTSYTGSFTITADTPHGATTYKFSGKDVVGNRGYAQGTGITIDVKGPEATIQSPVSTLAINPDPVTVDVVLNEASVTAPVLQLKAADGTLSLVSNPTSTDSGIYWTGTMDVSSLPEGKAEFILQESTDGLGNIGTTVSSGRYVLLYSGAVPPPGIPEGLAATSGKNGSVTLSWYPVVYTYSDLAAVTYNLYRRAEGETEATKIQTGLGTSTGSSTGAMDTPAADGTYYYSVTAVGVLGSESPLSPEVQAISDRTGPEAPTGLALSLTSSGVSATWTAPAGETGAMTYNLYRSNAFFTSRDGLTAVASASVTNGTDTSPSKTYRYYAVAALDYLGNEGPLSESREIAFEVSPVNNLVVEKIDDAAPTLTWEAPDDSGIAGYSIYRNGSPITSYPVLDLSFTDAYYTNGTYYGISAVDSNGNESPIKTVTLPGLSLGLKDGTTFRRGVLEAVQLMITPGSDVTIDSVNVTVGTAPASSIQGPFSLSANGTLQLEKIAATTSDASSPVSVLIQAVWSPSPGVSVKVSRTVSADVTGSSSSFEIFNEPLQRNTDGKVQFKVNNIGSAQMEFLTSENNTKTSKVKVYLKDQDGNVLSTGYLDQRVGTAIVNGNGYAVARLNPNESILTDPITISVPSSAPDTVFIEAVIENTYYHYSQSDEVIAPGMKGTVEAVIQDTAYRATAAPEKTFYTGGESVVINGSATSNDTSLNGQPVPNVSVKLVISVSGYDRTYSVTTDAAGKFSYTFTPSSTEAGTYSIWAVHPDVNDRTVQATFTIAGMSVSPGTANVTMARGATQDVAVTVTNYGGGSLTGLNFETASSTGITASVINNGDATVTAGENQSVTFRITTDSSSPDTGWATLTAKTAEGVNATLNASITVVDMVPIISTSPSYIDTGMVRGDQKISTFTITNTGQETLKNAYIEGPSTSWMTLTQSKTIGDIAAGGSAAVNFMFSPADTVSQGVYDDQIVIYSDNHIPYTYHIQVTVTTDAVGNVYFDVLNILSQDVENATITFQNQSLPELLYSVKTGADGTASQYDIPEGSYVYTVSPPPGHKSTSGTFAVTAGLTTPVYIALDMQLVEVTWSVVPTTIEDEYEIQITQTFETNVPVPVLVTEPASVTLPEMQPGEVFNGEYQIKNYGLIAAENVKMEYPASIEDYDVEIFQSAIPDRIEALGSITVAYRVTRRQTTAMTGSILNENEMFAVQQSPTWGATLYSEVRGYGGDGCVTSGSIIANTTYIACKNQPQEKEEKAEAQFTLGVQKTCPTNTSSGSYVPTPSSTSVGGGQSSQSSGSAALPSQPTAISTEPGNPCECTENCDQVQGCSGDFVCIGEECTEIVQKAPDDCKREVCSKEAGGIISENNDGETPPQGTLPECVEEYKCQKGSKQPVYKKKGATCKRDSNICTDDFCDGYGTCTHPENNASCDDNLFCTSYDAVGTVSGPDMCEAKICKGNNIPDTSKRQANFRVDMSNGYPQLKKWLLEWAGEDMEAYGEISWSLIDRCCETKDTIFKDAKASLTVKAVLPLGEVPIPGLSAKIPFDLGSAGLFLRVSIEAGGSGSFEEQQCTDTVQGTIDAILNTEVSLDAKFGNDIARVIVSATTGLSANLTGSFSRSGIAGTASFDFDGLGGSIAVSFANGEYEYEEYVQFIESEPVGDITVSIPIQF